MTDEELQELRRAALAGDEEALARLETHLRRESEPAPGEEARGEDRGQGPSTPDIDGDTTIGDRMRQIALSPDNILGTAIGMGLGALAMRALGDTQGATVAGRAVRRVLGLPVPDLQDTPPAPRRRRRRSGKAKGPGTRRR